MIKRKTKRCDCAEVKCTFGFDSARHVTIPTIIDANNEKNTLNQGSSSQHSLNREEIILSQASSGSKPIAQTPKKYHPKEAIVVRQEISRLSEEFKELLSCLNCLETTEQLSLSSDLADENNEENAIFKKLPIGGMSLFFKATAQETDFVLRTAVYTVSEQKFQVVLPLLALLYIKTCQGDSSFANTIQFLKHTLFRCLCQLEGASSTFLNQAMQLFCKKDIKAVIQGVFFTFYF